MEINGEIEKGIGIPQQVQVNPQKLTERFQRGGSKTRGKKSEISYINFKEEDEK